MALPEMALLPLPEMALVPLPEMALLPLPARPLARASPGHVYAGGVICHAHPQDPWPGLAQAMYIQGGVYAMLILMTPGQG